jgi:hypothetical protein
LWADTRADEADDWAIAYLGALVGARPVNALNRAGQRANLARTILYRRRQGTAPLAERLADDIADWDGVAREAFLRLFRLWHQLDSGPLPGPITRSPRWGYPDLRNARIGEILDGAHDDLAHRPDVRRQRGVVGRYGIAKLNLHLFRVYAYPIGGVTPYRVRDDLFTIDPSGRDVPLFQVGGRDIDDCVAAREWQMRAPLTCRRLQAGAFEPVREHAPCRRRRRARPRSTAAGSRPRPSVAGSRQRGARRGPGPADQPDRRRGGRVDRRRPGHGLPAAQPPARRRRRQPVGRAAAGCRRPRPARPGTALRRQPPSLGRNPRPAGLGRGAH